MVKKNENTMERERVAGGFAFAPLSVGADHYRRAQHDAHIGAGDATANNLILHSGCYLEGLLSYSTVGVDW